MPFGLTNTPSTFPRLKNHVLISLIGKCVVVYFDDILVYSNCLDDYILHVKSMLLLLRQECLYTSLEKCTFCTSKVMFLGYVVSVEGVEVDIEKDSQERSFQALKDKLTNAFILALSNFSKTFKLECDVSNVGVGAVLLQEGHLIAYFSEKLKDAQKKFSTYDKKLYAIMIALQVEFVIHSDHEALKHLRIQNKLNKRHVKWVKFLKQFPYIIKHKQGEINIVDDALSRRHALLSMLEAKILRFEQIKGLYLKDEYFGKIYELCTLGANGGFYIHKEFLFKDKRLYVPKNSIRELLVKEDHKMSLMEHFKEHKTYKTLYEHFFWSYMKRDLHHIYDICLICKHAKSKVKPYSFYMPFLILVMPWIDISMLA
ncbi:Retrovirus-related Pol polyprotein from transposon 17.6, partial [Mucuna pruriens]